MFGEKTFSSRQKVYILDNFSGNLNFKRSLKLLCIPNQPYAVIRYSASAISNSILPDILDRYYYIRVHA